MSSAFPSTAAGSACPTTSSGRRACRTRPSAGSLTRKLGFPVIVDNNVRCFSLAIAGPRAVHDSMLVVTVRSGIGVGIVMNRRIYKGERGCPGEIGHFSVEANGAPCRCGKRGCLETVVNRDALASSLEGLRRGDHAARKSLAHAADLLGQAIGNLMLVVDIRHVTIYAELGDLGPALLPPVRAAILRSGHPGLRLRRRLRDAGCRSVRGGCRSTRSRRIRPDLMRLPARSARRPLAADADVGKPLHGARSAASRIGPYGEQAARGCGLSRGG